MSLTKEMIMMIDQEVQNLPNDLLKVYHSTYSKLNEEYPNSFFKYRIKRSEEEMNVRGEQII